jgi:hypothetical protein
MRSTALNRPRIGSNATYWSSKENFRVSCRLRIGPLPVTLLSTLGGIAFWCSLEITLNEDIIFFCCLKS